MTAGERDLEPAPRLELAADLAQVRDRGRGHVPRRRPPSPPPIPSTPPRRVRSAAAWRSPRRPRRVRMSSTAPVSVSTPVTSIPSTRRASSTASAGDHDPPQPAPGERGHHRQDARHRSHLATERQLADHRDPARPGSNLLRPEQDPDGHREVERRAGLAQVRRREVDRDPAGRVDEPAVAQRATDALASLLERRVGEPDDREAGQARCDIHLDADEPAVEAVKRRGWDDRQHARRLRTGAYHAVPRDLPAAYRRLATPVAECPSGRARSP